MIMEDDSSTILSENKSPDLNFRWSINPYRGCIHGCSYCYARPTHEYLDMGAGTDFETRIVIKPAAAALLRAAFERPSWTGELICFSGVTDCYQGIEARYRLTRACLEICVEYRNPVQIITRSPLVTRDIDLFKALVEHQAISVSISLPIVDRDTCRHLEPYAPPPIARLRAIEKLSSAGIPVSVSLSPIIFGINDHTIVDTLKQAKAAGATHAWMMMLRLPGAVEENFIRRLNATMPLRANRVLNAIRGARDNGLNETRFGDRMTGRGAQWTATQDLFEIWQKRLDMSSPPPSPHPTPFRRRGQGVQIGLF